MQIYGVWREEAGTCGIAAPSALVHLVHPLSEACRALDEPLLLKRQELIRMPEEEGMLTGRSGEVVRGPCLPQSIRRLLLAISMQLV